MEPVFFGESFTLKLSAKDADNVVIVLDETYSAACRITKGKIGGIVAANPDLTLEDGAFQAEIDTRQEGWAVGIYFYDFRLTDPNGEDHWTKPDSFEIQTRNSPPSA